MNHLVSLFFLFLALHTPLSAEERIVFLGDSLTAGHGLPDDEAYPALIQEKLQAEGYTNYLVKNAGVSGDTTAGGLRRLKWVLKEEPAIFVLALGANDGLRGLPLRETERNLEQIFREVQTLYPNCLLLIAGMELPVNLGEEYRAQFRQIFPEIARRNRATLIPFLLEGVAGSAELNQGDGIHPTAEGHKRIAENVWQILKTQLRK